MPIYALCVFKEIFSFFLIFGSSQIEIKNHIFFSPINWDDLNAKKITPPFNPNVVCSFLIHSKC